MAIHFLHTADIHLDSPLRGLEAHDGAPVSAIRRAARRAFDNLIESAIARQVAFVIIAGDLFDGDWRDYNTGLYFVQRMGRLEREGIRVFLVSGNHDASNTMSRELPLPPNVHRFSARRAESFVLEDLGIVLHGMSYARRVVSENLAAAFPQQDPRYCNIGVLHTSLNGREGHEVYAPCSVGDLLTKGYAYWALGHVHKREIINRDPWIVFPGNLQGRHSRESGAKGATLVTLDHGQVVTVQQLDLDVLRWACCEVDITSCTAAAEVYDLTRSALTDLLQAADGRPLAVRLRLVGSTTLHAGLAAQTTRWQEELRAIAVGLGDIWLEKILVATSRPHAKDGALTADPALEELTALIDSITLDDQLLAGLGQDLAPLKTKVPAQLFAAAIGAPQQSQEQLQGLKDEIQDLLLGRLLRQGGEL